MDASPALAKNDPPLDALRAALAAWFEAHQRPMPWRAKPSLYGTVVSEFMLQQTRVDTVRPYFERWTTRWPGFRALSLASEAEVVKAWEGLGYYTRARNLRRLAIEVAARPVPPQAAREWEKLPGVGPYTAAAIASIACGEPVAVVDGNVVRVLARLTADPRLFKDNGTAVKAFAEPAQRLLSPAAPGTHNQAVMELGALVCLPRSPRCGECPARPFCAAAASGSPEDFPRFAPRKVEKIAIARLLCVDAGRILLFRHGADARRLAGIYELPDARLLPVPQPDISLPLAVKHRAISNQQITETIHRCEMPGRMDTARATGGTLEWIPLSALPAISLSGPHRKWLPALLDLREFAF